VTDARHCARRRRRGQRQVRKRTAHTHLEQRDEVDIVVAQACPLGRERRHENLDEHRVLERGPDGVRKRADGVVEDEHVLVLVLLERKHEVAQHGFEVWHELRARVLLERRERAAAGLLHAFVVV
jgi:hypothetical protein